MNAVDWWKNRRLATAAAAVTVLLLLGAVWMPLSVPQVPPVLAPDQARFAEHALQMAPAAFDAPLARPLIWRVAVRDVQPLPDPAPACDDVPGLAPYRATVDALGPFGIVVARATVECGTASTRWMVGG